MTSSLSIYSKVKQEVDKTFSVNQDEKTWFENRSLPSKIYEYVNKQHANSLQTEKKEIIQKIATTIWRVCIYTAPVALSIVAPEESYKNRENAFQNICLLCTKEDIDRFPDIKIGIDLFKQTLEKPLEGENKGFSLLCNLYCGTHAFVIEKRSNDCCVLYQSYLISSDLSKKQNYSFQDFLKDETKHISWKPEKLISCLQKIISSESSEEKRSRNYEKLFFCKNNFSFEQKDFLYPYRLIFVDTLPYLVQ